MKGRSVFPPFFYRLKHATVMEEPMKKKGKGKSPERYWKIYAAHIQRGLSALAILESLPEIEYPKPNKAVRIFLTKLETRFAKKDLGIRKQVVLPILSVIQTGLIVSRTKNESAKWFMNIVTKLGLEMSLGGALEVLDGFEAMDNFLLQQVKRKFLKFFSPEEVEEETPTEETADADDTEGSDEADELDESDDEEEETAPVASGEPEGEATG
jgi:hypothetical protein